MLNLLYTPEEIERISKTKEKNDKMEEYFNDHRSVWNKEIEPLFQVLALDLSNLSNSKKILEAQAMGLTLRQRINEQINYFLNRRSRETTNVKKIRQDKFVFYATGGGGLKTNLGEKAILIDGHLAESDRSIELIDSYIQFLRDSVKNLESLSYSIKNMIELLNYLGK
jgi:hypothetical protein